MTPEQVISEEGLLKAIAPFGVPSFNIFLKKLKRLYLI